MRMLNYQVKGFCALTLWLSLGCTAILADADSPGAIYDKYHQAMLKASTIDEVMSYLSKGACAKINASTAQEKPIFFGMVKAMMPQAVQVVSEKIEGDKAEVKLEGISSSQSSGAADQGGVVEKSTGIVDFIREDGTWKVDRESYDTKIQSTKDPAPAGK